ncbi:alpha/beta fold hydrolase [Chengkuizengella axinellae]|uniref:Alpha/beta fold hydrolase n=1 Tax=Chengkuizengella axinellae TaxID=3064388 RepID=A0ABT9J489_9BACL|nr:alpha/beta fold hydrolase [Chengkuizengella sp. 2205SS18-9]MDP5276411.1 alpha/beta fold hydrolase [Chengkuizengella sp. 2205SS18-9]
MNRYLPGLAFLTFMLQAVIEGMRWQLIPIYTLVVLFLMFSIPFLQRITFKKIRLKKMGYIVMISFIVISLLFTYAFPVYKMPVPKGKYEVGTVSFDLIDVNRNAIYSDDLSNNRKVKMQVWYPAEDVKGYEQVPWLGENPKAVAEGISSMMGFPKFILSHTALVMSNSYEDAPIIEGKDSLPVVIISHGWTGFSNVHADVAELLASHGYIAISIDHTYGSAVTVFNDGEVAYVNENALPEREITPNYLEYANKLVRTFAGDILLTLNTLEDLNEVDSKFENKLDLSNIGLIGHSTGGGASVYTALNDDRVKAVLGMDAWVEPIQKNNLEAGLQVPSLFLRSYEWEEGRNNENLFILLDENRTPTELFQINGTGHQDFSMIYMYSPLSKYFQITGELDGREGAAMQHDFILNFFDLYLKGNADKSVDEVSKQYEAVEKIYSKTKN